jgi:hypothetical protein
MTQINPEFFLGGGLRYVCEVIAPDGIVLQRGEHTNLIPQVGVDYLAGLFMGISVPVTDWYVGIYEANYVPVRSVKSSDLPGTVGESTAYTQSERPSWNKEYDGVGKLTSINGRAEFTFTADKTLYGGFVVSQPAKGGNSGVLLSITRFPTPYTVPAGSTFRLYQEVNVVA